ncbi:hypothetical protein [Gracilibacillus sp. JCM 18860]|uniref:hypothetical protein n=1 Tax=Gracilibacillus sp. JCM 18860 TaxID=1306159 RepID=UPI003260B7B7
MNEIDNDLNDFVTKENIKRLIFEEKSLQKIMEEDEYTYLTKERLEPPHFYQLKKYR